MKLRTFSKDERAQSLVEFALVLPPLLLLLVFGIVEIGGLLGSSMTLASAAREGARVGGALVNGGGALGCGSGQSPNAAIVDPNIVAAVERVLTGNGSKIVLSDIVEIRIWKSTAGGTETAGAVDQWTYSLNGGPTVDGQPLDFRQMSQPWLPCTRSNVAPSAVDSVGVTVRYTYRSTTPLRTLFPYFDGLVISDKTVMSMNASR